MEPRPHPPATQRQPHRRSSHPDVILREPGTTRRRPPFDESLATGAFGSANDVPLVVPQRWQPTAWQEGVVLFVQAPNAWLDGTCHFPSPGLRDNGIFFFKNPNPVLPTDAGQLPVALTASIRRTTRGLVGHQEGCQPRAPRAPRLFHGESAPKTASVWLHLHFLPRGHKYCEATPGLIGPLLCLPLFCLFPQPHFCAGQTLCYVGQNGSFLAGKRKSLVSVANLFPFFGVTSGLLFGLPFWWFLGDLIRAGGTALLGILDCLSEGCYDVGMSSLDWGHPSSWVPRDNEIITWLDMRTWVRLGQRRRTGPWTDDKSIRDVICIRHKDGQ